MRSCRRYSTARSEFHELKTASTARSICSRGSCGNSRPACSTDKFLVGRGERLQVLGVQFRVARHALGLLRGVDRVLEVLAVDVEHGLAEHLDQPPVGVPGEPLVARLLGQAVDRLVRQADVQDGVHHAGHGELGAGPDADQQRVGGVAELAAHGPFQCVQVAADFIVKAVGGGALRQVVAARLGRDREPGGHGQAEIGHLGQVRALASQEVLEILVTFCEVIDELRH